MCVCRSTIYKSIVLSCCSPALSSSIVILILTPIGLNVATWGIPLTYTMIAHIFIQTCIFTPDVGRRIGAEGEGVDARVAKYELLSRMFDVFTVEVFGFAMGLLVPIGTFGRGVYVCIRMHTHTHRRMHTQKSVQAYTQTCVHLERQSLIQHQ